MSKTNKFQPIASKFSTRNINTKSIGSLPAIICLMIFAAGMLVLPNTIMKASAGSFTATATEAAPLVATTPDDAGRKEAKRGQRAQASPRRTASARPKARTRRGANHKLALSRDRKRIKSLIAKRLEKELRPNDSPGEAQEFYFLKRAPIAKDASPDGAKGSNLKRDSIPVERYPSAIEHIKSMPVYSTALKRSFASESEAALAPVLATWTPIGPGNVGGRTRGLVIDPSNANIMYAAGVAGGVWKSTNGGSSWTPLNDQMANLAVCSLVMDPNNSSILYAGTGEGYFNIDKVRGNGIFKTTDAGGTWAQLTTSNDSNFFFVNDIVVSKGDSQRVYAGTSTGVWRSTNGGANWTQVHNPGQQGGCLDLVIRTDNLAQDVVLASFGTFTQATVYRNLDAGAAGVWTSVFSDPGMGRTALAIAPSNQQTMYALAASITAGTFNNGLQGVFRSTDGGGTWAARVRNSSASKINTVLLTNPVIAYLTECGFGTSSFNNQGWYDNIIAVDPLDPDRVWVAGIDTFRSDDGGANFGIASHWWASTASSVFTHADHHAIVFDPGFNGTTNKIMYLGNDGGLFKTTDARAAVGVAGANNGVTSVCSQVTSVPWSKLNNGYFVTQFYDGVMYPDGQTYFGGTQDNGTIRGTSAGGSNWTTILGGDGGYVAVDPTTVANPATTVLFAENTGRSIQKSSNGGSSFVSATTGITESSGQFLFIAPFIMDPGNAQRLWTGGFFMWRTTNSAGSWTQASAITCGNGSVSAIAAAPTDGNKVLAGMSDGCINRTSVGLTSTSATVWPSVTPRNGFVSWVTFDPVNSNIAYATYSSFNSVGTDRHVYKSTDSGATWAGIDGSGATGIPDIPVHTIVVDPVSTSTLYIGTDLGVFTTTDGGSTWMKENTGFANVITESLKINSIGGVKTLFAFTHGRGAWRVQAGGPTAAKVNEFTATSFSDGRVLLKWKSAHEVNNLGYNLYRQVGSLRTRITSQLIAGSALITGADVALTAGKSYAWADQPRSAATSYWLEDIDLSGKSSWSGPVTVKPSTATGAQAIQQSLLLNKIGLSQGQMRLGLGSSPIESKAEVARLSPDTAQLQTTIAGGPAVKLLVKQEGWYHIAQRDLISVGLDSRVDPRNLQLFADGQQVAISVTGEQDGRLDAGDAVEFYGVGINSTQTDTHVYWLVSGTQAGKRIKAIKTGQGPASAASFPYTVERKDRTLYFSALRNGEAENFFGPVIAATAVEQSLMLQNVSAAAPSAASLSVAVQGVTATAHSVRVMLNGEQVGVISFSGQETGKLTVGVSQGQLREGSNLVELASGGGTDISLVDSVRITYWHKLVADSNMLKLTATGGQQVTISGFTSTDIRVMDVTDGKAVQELTGVISGPKTNASISVTPTEAGGRLLLAFTGDRAKIAEAKANEVSGLHEEGQVADYVVITRGEMKGSFERLRTLREGQGQKVMIVDVEDIYDEFSYGNKRVEAIKEFLKYTTQGWRVPPRYVLMGGDSSYDMKNYLGYGDGDIVPTKLIDTFYMEAASDEWIVDFDGDGVGEMATGRLPVRNVDEAGAMIGKIVSYESSQGSNSVMMAADANDGYNFAGVNEDLRMLLPEGMRVEEVTRGTGDDGALKSELLGAINRGETIVNYNGHGSVDQWRGNLLTNEDAAGMTNIERLAMFVMMTCMNGYYNDPGLDSLAEALMRARGGAIAVWASSAQCEPIGQGEINKRMYEEMFGGGNSVGEAARRAKMRVSDADIRRTWILFGDPAMRIR